MVKIAVVEDDKKLGDELLSFLQKYSQENKEELNVKYFACTTDFISQNERFDIVFMDINIKNDMTGLEASKRLREKDSVVTIIFVTSFEQFAVKGYEVGAFDFMVKPVAYWDFSCRFKRALLHVAKENNDKINIRVKGNLKVLSVRDIKYIEVIKHNLLLHCVNGIEECTGSLNDMESQLVGEFFVRCNHCYLVNLWYVRGVNGYSLDLDGEEIAISRSKKPEFMSLLNRYLGK